MQSRASVALLICSLVAACGDDEGTSSLSAASQTSNNSTAGSASSSSSSSSSDGSTSDGSSGSATGTSAGSETTDASTSSDSTGPDPTTTSTTSGTTSGTTTGGGAQCGNGLVDPGEQCDGGNLGSFTCTSLGYDGGGTLSCDPVMCTLDTSMCISGGGSTSG